MRSNAYIIGFYQLKKAKINLINSFFFEHNLFVFLRKRMDTWKHALTNSAV